ncbi:MAG: ACT domain-containing protein [Firmicutes bacterium]|nr:ACT domain-containing protein [Bacillota bacterium]
MYTLRIEPLDVRLSVCKVSDYSGIDPEQPFVFTGCTDEEKSLVCPTALVPENAFSREDGWRAFRICGQLDFSLTGILAKISKKLADAGIGIFALSTYNTDYILIKEENYARALELLCSDGFDKEPLC